MNDCITCKAPLDHLPLTASNGAVTGHMFFCSTEGCERKNLVAKYTGNPGVSKEKFKELLLKLMRTGSL
jgi:hypothetical protein